MKKKKWKLSTILLLLIGIGLIITALVLLIPPLLDRKQANDTYEELKETNVIVEESVSIKEQEGEKGEETGENNKDSWWYEDVEIDIAGLQEINEDIMGWIRFDSIEIISYPVLYSGDDEAYLKTDIYGNKSSAGCIFIEGANSPDLLDCHTIIYGHNMKNGSMFGSLKKYKEESFYEENQYFTIYLRDTAYRYQIFAYRDVPDYHSVYTVGFLPDETFQQFVNEMRAGSYKDTGIEVSKEDQVVTLSTCSAARERFVIHAVKVEEHTY